MTCDFSLRHYREIINTFLQKHKFIFFHEAQKSSRQFVILRHDVDYSLKLALKMAQIDKTLGIKATFFILISCPYYNIFARETYQTVKKILILGHQIGFHYDGEVIEKYGLNPQAFLQETISYLEKIFSTKIIVISQHNPGKAKKIIVPSNYLNAYSAQFTGKIKYLSDSCQKWYEGCLCQLAPRYPRIQILIHPYLWSEKSLKLDQLRQGLTKEKIQEFKDWEKFFKQMNIKHQCQM